MTDLLTETFFIELLLSSSIGALEMAMLVGQSVSMLVRRSVGLSVGRFDLAF